MNEVSAKSMPSRPAWSAMQSAALATLSAVPRSMRFHLRYSGIGRQVDRSRPEHERQLRLEQRADDRAHPDDPDRSRRLVGAEQDHQRELALADLRGGNERQPVAGRAEHTLVRAVLHQRLDQWRRIKTHLRGGEAALQHHLAVVEHADVERDRPRIDAGDSGQTSSLAIS